MVMVHISSRGVAAGVHAFLTEGDALRHVATFHTRSEGWVAFLQSLLGQAVTVTTGVEFRVAGSACRLKQAAGVPAYLPLLQPSLLVGLMDRDHRPRRWCRSCCQGALLALGVVAPPRAADASYR